MSSHLRARARARSDVGETYALAAALLPLVGALLASPVGAQGRLRAAPVSLELSDRRAAETLAAVRSAVELSPFRVEERGERFRIRSALAVARERGQPPPDGAEPGTVLLVDGVHDGLGRLYGRLHQEVRELPPSTEAPPIVVVQTEAERAVLVITGPEAERVPSLEAPPPSFGGPIATDGPGWAVRHLGPQRSEPLEVPVPVGARVSLVTRYVPIRLRFARELGGARLRGDPADPRMSLSVRLDGRALAAPLVPANELGMRGDPPGTRRVELPEDVPPGPHRLRAELTDRETGEVIAFVGGDYYAPRRWRMRVRAGAGPECITLDGEAVAHPSRIAFSYGAVRARVRPGRRRGSYLGEGTEICLWVMPIAGAERRIMPLARGTSQVAAVLDLEIEPLSPILLWTGPLLVALLGVLWLARGFWPRAEPPVTHLAWAAERDGGYRERGELAWTLTPLPDGPTPLSALDESLADRAHRIGRAGAGRAVLDPAGPVVVAPPGPHAISTQVSELSLPSGTQVLDDGLRLALLGDRAAAALRAGGTLSAPDPEAVARARAAGFAFELVVPRPARRSLRALAILLGAAVPALASLAPLVLTDGLGPDVRIHTDTVYACAAASLGALAFLGALVELARLRRRRLYSDAP